MTSPFCDFSSSPEVIRLVVMMYRQMHDLRRAIDHEGEVLESFASKTSDRPAALKFMKKLMKRHGRPQAVAIRAAKRATPCATPPDETQHGLPRRCHRRINP